ncbi:IclR family transcriptional regulator [Streptomyces acidicola]|uniref:IclR family transcriptional regulator n=1 Tax=Streptomyces acidicola TaxID=2596892 RepID=UPI0034438EDE
MPKDDAAPPAKRRGDARDGDIQAVSRCAQILRMVADQQSVRASDVAVALGLQRSTAHRYLASMAGAGLIERGEDGGFVPGPLAVHLGSLAMRRARVLDIAGPYMSALAAEAHETVVLSLWGGSGAVVTRVAEDPTRLVNISVREGGQLQPHAAQSQVFLAYLPEREQVRRLLSLQSPYIREELEQSIENVRRTGFGAYSTVVQGIHAVAAPIFDSRATICATLALVGTSDSLVAAPDSHLWQALGKVARKISAQLGHTGTLPDTAGS